MRVVAIVVSSIDGFIAKGKSELINWSCKEDKAMFAQETRAGGVVVMGLNTYLTLPCALKERLNIVLTSKPNQFQNQEGIIEFTSLGLKPLLKQLKDKGFKKVFVIGGQYTFTKFIEEKLLDEIWISFEPLIFGQGVTLFSKQIENLNCSLYKTKKLNHNAVQLRYKINY